ncbi:MAG: undecaprenyl-phosphate galactose phosphotransferase WbaP [Anaerolineaceae bacterium]
MGAQETVKTKKQDTIFSTPTAFVPLLQRNARGWMTLFLILTDLAGLFATIALSFVIQKFVLLSSPNPEIYRELLILPLVFVIITYTSGLYPALGLNSVEELRRQTMSTSLVFLSLIGLTFITKSSLVYSRFLFFSCWTILLVVLPLNRALLRSLLPHFSNWGEPVAIIGPYENAVDIAGYLKLNRWIGLRSAAIFDDSPQKSIRGETPLMPLKDLRDFCILKKIDSAVVISSSPELLFKSQGSYDDLFKRVVFIPLSADRPWLSGISVMEYGDLVGFEIKHNLLDKWSQAYKRVIDLVISLVGLIILTPTFLIIALILKLDSPGRIFYRQTRLGKNDRKFVMVKFRTMQINADQVLRNYLSLNPLQHKEWDQYQKLRNDPRITRFGRLLRRFSIDEFPQLWNVLKGEMSLVGPRPIVPEQFDLYGKSYSLYKKVNPGITGLWQISGRASTSFCRRVELDNTYVTNWSIWLDILILVKSFWVVVKQKGAF